MKNKLNSFSGLTKEEVKIRVKKSLVNYDTTSKTKSVFRIILEKIFTLFNILNLLLGIIVIFLGQYKNCLFLIVVFCNTIIRIISELRYKKIMDKLSILATNKVKVIRDNKVEEIDVNEIVLDDVIKLDIGDQVVVDSVILEGECLVNESFITGEADSISKKKKDVVLSGSFIVSGSIIVKVIHIGNENYTSVISNEARVNKKINSEIMIALNKIIKIISILIIPLGILFLINQLSVNSINNALLNMVAALVGMIPEGLVLLTSSVLLLSVIRLAKEKILVQDLYCIETLARVDTVCLDKTGTLTTGKVILDEVINVSNDDIDQILCAITSAIDDGNATIMAIKEKYNSDSSWKIKNISLFSSDKKYTSIEFYDKGIYKLGAIEFITEDYNKNELDFYYKNYRVLGLFKDEKIIAYLLFKDEIRCGIKNTINYFKKNNIDLKIITGDNPITASMVAKQLDIPNYDKYIDLSNVDEKDIESIVLKYSIFGRVTPNKKKLLILALKKLNHTVAMVGDGVNDVLALKNSDCAIAFSSAVPSARNVSDIVLLNPDISVISSVVKEGRRTINNIERSAVLFLTKTVYNTLLLLLYLFIDIKYPLIPIQLTLISVITIGLPGFVLALEYNESIVKKNFLVNILKKALPAALTVFINIIILLLISSVLKFDLIVVTTLAILLIVFPSFISLYNLCKPFNKLRKILFLLLIIIFFLSITLFKDFFGLCILKPIYVVIVVLLMINSYFLLIFFYNLIDKFLSNKRI